MNRPSQISFLAVSRSKDSGLRPLPLSIILLFFQISDRPFRHSHRLLRLYTSVDDVGRPELAVCRCVLLCVVILRAWLRLHNHQINFVSLALAITSRTGDRSALPVLSIIICPPRIENTHTLGPSSGQLHPLLSFLASTTGVARLAR